MIDRLLLGDSTVRELAQGAGLPGNLAAHHLDVLEAAGLIERRISEGDHRRRYVVLRSERLAGLQPVVPVTAGPVLFVCTHNSARSQFAGALWRRRTGGESDSAGTDPAARVHPYAVAAAQDWDLDLRGAVPKGYAALTALPELVVSVCDRAREAGDPFGVPTLHWSVPDPVRDGRADAFRRAFRDIASRVEQLAKHLERASTPPTITTPPAWKERP
jgi:protein-tyrosine-phosphatase